jgi:hypothetical protein
MPEYYFLKGKDQLGPFSLQELQQQPILPETMVWHEALPEWIPASELTELKIAMPLLSKTLPMEMTRINTSKTKNFPLQESDTFLSELKKHRWLAGWIVFHSIALMLSLKEVKLFNATGEPKPEKFWPLVKFTNPFFDTTYNRTFVLFNGMFTQYDWTEFSFYIGIAIFFVILRIVYKKSS